MFSDDLFGFLVFVSFRVINRFDFSVVRVMNERNPYERHQIKSSHLDMNLNDTRSSIFPRNKLDSIYLLPTQLFKFIRLNSLSQANATGCDPLFELN